MDIYKCLKDLDIKYEEIEHPAIYTVEEGKKINREIEGIGCKNLFLKDHKGHFFVVSLEKDKEIKLNDLRKYLHLSNLHFADEQYLHDLLGVIKGSVTPLGIINDKDNKVIIVLDEELVNKKLLFHPLVNTKTINIEYKDLIKFIESLNHRYIIIKKDS